MYRLQLQFGVPDNVGRQVMNPQYFQTHVVRPGDRPIFLEGPDTAAADATVAVDDDAVDDEATQS
ncbi:hypothetical protein A2U01_0089629, partial [Trifolium medium]|nr:hypothetical protein [Trifolium medium]